MSYNSSSFALRFPLLPLCIAAALHTACGESHNNGGTGGEGGSGASNGSSSSSSGAGGGIPTPTCPPPIQPADISTPNAVVGTGTPESCTEAALDEALTKAGVIVFNCGDAPATIAVTSEKAIKADTILDGGGKVTLSGGGKTRILHVASAWDQASPKLTVQHLAFTGGFTTDVMNTKETDQGGAAIFREGGTLEVIDCQFTDNHCAKTGQDVSGGAITSQGIGPTTIVGSTFIGNGGSNGGAVGNLGNSFTVTNSVFDSNAATGTDGNPGNGGNGGAIVFDGADTTMTICGSTFTKNTSGAQGGAIFRVAYSNEPTVIDRCAFDGNASDATVGLAGALYLEHTHITMTATLIANNKAHYGGGFWIGQSAVADLTNVTIANNTSDQGGGLWFANDVSGTFLHCTIVDNEAGYGSGLFNGSNAVQIEESILANNNCKNGPFSGGSNNIGFMGGDGCVGGALAEDPMLGPLQDNGGPTNTKMPSATSPAIGKGMNCPATDQRGEPRKSPCTLGAVEAE